MTQAIGMLRNFLDVVETKLDVTEPAAMDDCSVVCLAPAKGGLVGLDEDTGRPLRVGWKYKTIDEKPVIINAGNKQTVIPPKLPAPPPPIVPTVTAGQAGNLFDVLRVHAGQEEFWTEPDVQAENNFVLRCLANPDFFFKWQARLAVLEAASKFVSEPEPEPEPGWPAPNRARQRIVDT